MGAAASLVDALPDFAPWAGADRRAFSPLLAVEAPEPVAALPDPAVLEAQARETEALIRAEVEAAESRLRFDMMQEQVQAAAEAEERHATEMRAALEACGDALRATIGQRMTALADDIVRQTADVVARILAPLVSAGVQARALDALAATIRAALADREAVRLTLTGPQSLLEAIGPRIEDVVSAIRIVEEPRPDLRLTVDESLYETRLAEWAAILPEAVA